MEQSFWLELRKWYLLGERNCTRHTACIESPDVSGIQTRYALCMFEVQSTSARLLEVCACTKLLWWSFRGSWQLWISWVLHRNLDCFWRYHIRNCKARIAFSQQRCFMIFSIAELTLAPSVDSLDCNPVPSRLIRRERSTNICPPQHHSVVCYNQMVYIGPCPMENCVRFPFV